MPPPPRDAPVGTPPGQVSSWVFGLRPGDEVVIAGPSGEFFAAPGDADMVFIGGWAGMTPLHCTGCPRRPRGTRDGSP
jgi:Na+-transporting NADH:ubiquinone oxidoreductase subunit F